MLLTGQVINDYKAGIVYRIDSIKKIKNGKTVIMCEFHGKSINSPILGYDVIILNSDLIIPTSEKWGESAWSWITREQAIKSYAQIE